jgi:cystathionine beta-lyase
MDTLSRRSIDFDRPVHRGGTYSEKWEKYKGRDVIPLWLADMDFESPPAVIESLHQRVDHGVFGYTRAPEELYETVLAMLHDEYGWKVDREWIVWLPGLVTGLNVVCRAVGEIGDTVLTAVPVYPYFMSAAQWSQRELTTVSLVEDSGNWTFDFDRLEAAITPRTRLLILCNPHNPVGRVYTRQELETLADICMRHDIVICSDEIHCGLLLDQDKTHIPTATLDKDIAQQTITLMSPSKTFNLPGLGLAFAIIPDEELRRRVNRAKSGIVPWVNALAYTAAIAAYKEGSEWHREVLSYLRVNRDMVQQAIHEMPRLQMAHVEATYLAWIDTRALELEDPASFFEQAGVGLACGKPFEGPGFVRLGFGCPRATLMKALERMRVSMEQFPR